MGSDYHNDLDTHSAAAVARILGTSTPRVLRAIRRLRLPVARSPSGTSAITAAQLDALRAELGEPIVVGLTRVQTRVLAALARSPRGLASIRSVARRAGVSPSAAGRALNDLTPAGLARAKTQTLPMGHATPTLI